MKVSSLDYDEGVMRIGLIRHFKVQEGLPKGWTTAAQLYAWRSRYESSQVTPAPLNLGDIHWDTCLSSDIDRAVTTAKAAFEGEIEYTPLLREAEFTPLKTGPLRLPSGLWRQLYRLVWLSGHHSQRACRDDFRSRVMAVADLLEKRCGNTLVVCHAGMMVFLALELRHRGFTGPKLRMPDHATVYLYEQTDSVPKEPT